MVNVKPASEIDKNFRDAIPRVAKRYQDGVKRTQNWHEKASSDAAEDLYGQKIAEAVSAKRRQKGLANTSNAEWQNRAATKGAKNIGPGMSAGADKRMRNYEPHRVALEGLQLTDRTADAMANIDNRVKPVVQTLVDTRKAQRG